jgi:hypothetical protein
MALDQGAAAHRPVAPEDARLPAWYTDLAALPHHAALRLDSWETDEWKLAQNYMHSPTAPCRVLGYTYDSSTETLHGVAYFSPQAQGHQGVCHGGCAQLDSLNAVKSNVNWIRISHLIPISTAIFHHHPTAGR